MRPWQCLEISDNWNHLSAYIIWNILVLNIKGKVSKIGIRRYTCKKINNFVIIQMVSILWRSYVMIYIWSSLTTLIHVFRFSVSVSYNLVTWCIVSFRCFFYAILVKYKDCSTLDLIRRLKIFKYLFYDSVKVSKWFDNIIRPKLLSTCAVKHVLRGHLQDKERVAF